MVDTPPTIINPCALTFDTALIVAVALSTCVPCAVNPLVADITAVFLSNTIAVAVTLEVCVIVASA